MRTVEVAAVCGSDEVTSNYHETYFSRGEEKRGTERRGDIAYNSKGKETKTAEPAQQALGNAGSYLHFTT